MSLPPRGRIEWNLNTVVLIAGFGATLIGWGAMWGSFTAEVRAVDFRHETAIRQQEAERRNHDDKSGIRLSSIEGDMRKLDNLAYRVTVVEQSQAATTQTLQELKATVNGQAADIKVMRVILEQLKEAQGLPRHPTPSPSR